MVYAQEDKTITLVVSGQGKTQDEAKQIALRSAIEQAFGAFISSKTEILNDNLVKDEIVSVTNGNIQKYEVISDVQIPDGGYATTLKATVSVSKLTSFCESKGVAVEFKGRLFAFNINQQILNEKNEIKAIDDLCKVAKTLSDISFDYSIKASEPTSVDAGNANWRIPLQISVKANQNFFLLTKYIYSTIKGLSLTQDEVLNYLGLGKLTYPICFAADKDNYLHVNLRSEVSGKSILKLIYYFNHSFQNFKITNGLSTFSIVDNPKNLLNIYDYGFRVLIKTRYGQICQQNFPSSIFYTDFRESIRNKISEKRNYDFHPGLNPILDYNKWITGHYGDFNLSVKALQGIDKIDLINNFQTTFCPTNLLNNQDNIEPAFRVTQKNYFIDQFSFVNSLYKDVVNSKTGIVISFIGINAIDDLVVFYLEDIRTLNEINQIKEYKILLNR
jgi:hypothetical protein